MADPSNDTARPSPSPDAPLDQEGPGYDPDKDDYAGIASTSTDFVKDIDTARDLAQMIVDTIREGLLVLDFDHRVKAANESFYDLFEVSPDTTLGRSVYDLGTGQWDIPELHELLDEVLPENEVFNDYRVEHDFKRIGRRVMLLNARRLDQHRLILLAIRDDTDRSRSEAELHEFTEQLEGRVTERTRQVHQLASMLTMAEQEERRRISQLLHDDVQQLLYGLQMKLSVVRQIADVSEPLDEPLDEIDALVDQAIGHVRSLAVDLSPPILATEGVVSTLEWTKTQMQELHGLEVEVEAEQAFRTPDDDMRVLLYQIVRELLFNVAKHAETDHATVTVRAPDDAVEVVVADAGCGFDVAAAGAQTRGRNSFGLFNVRERVRLFGGDLQIDSAPGEGTRVTVRVPLHVES